MISIARSILRFRFSLFFFILTLTTTFRIMFEKRRQLMADTVYVIRTRTGAIFTLESFIPITTPTFFERSNTQTHGRTHRSSRTQLRTQ